MEATAAFAYTKFHGAENVYTVIAERNGEFLGAALDYSEYNGKLGFRLVAYKEGNYPGPFKTLPLRGQASFSKFPATGDKFPGVRLVKLYLPLVSPPLPKDKIGEFLDLYKVPGTLAVWLKAQIEAEGFTVNVPDLAEFIKEELAPTIPEPKLVLELPVNFEVMKKATLQAHMPSVPDMEDETDMGDENDYDA